MEEHWLTAPLADPMRGNPEIDFTVMPDRLCHMCYQAIKLFADNDFFDELAAPPEKGNLYSSDFRPPFNLPLGHHATLKALSESAQDGCHLCSLLRASMPRGDQHVKGLFLRIDGITGSHGTHSRPKCQKVMLRLCEQDEHGKYETVHSPCVLLHRHLLHGEGDNCTEHGEHNHNFEDSVEFKQRWCTNTRSSVGLGTAHNWLQDCINNHNSCGDIMMGPGPTRLIDLQAFPDSEDCRLVLSDDLNHEELYATLSYRWGGGNHVTLQASNHEQLRSRFTTHNLPRTIKDAITICRSLSMRYLWVDALCLIQENGDDMMREVANMGSIYARCHFTISAADSTDSDSGCFRDRCPLYQENCVLVESDSIHWVLTPCVPYHDRGSDWPEESLLSERGWVLQERLMSPRTIHFTAGELVWECRERIRFLGSNYARRKTELRPPKNYGKGIMSTIYEGWGNVQHVDAFRKLWRNLLILYSRTELTNMDDRLCALAGIAGMAEKHLNLAASYGIWLDFFIEELAWFRNVEADPHDKMNELAPSWSWASKPRLLETTVTDEQLEIRSAVATVLPDATPFGRISYLHTRSNRETEPVSCTIRGWLKPCQVYPTIYSILFDSRELSWVIAPAIGQVSDEDQLQIQNRWDLYLSGVTVESDASRRFNPNLPARTNFYPDTVMRPRQNLVCLLLKRGLVRRPPSYLSFGEEQMPSQFSEGENIIDTGLILERMTTEKGLYRRIGYFQDVVSQKNIQIHKERQARESATSKVSETDEPERISQVGDRENPEPERTSRDATSDDIEMLSVDNEVEASTEISADSKIGYLPDSRAAGESEIEINVPDDTRARPQLIDIPVSKLPVFCYPPHFHAMINNLTLFNGNETVAEVKII